MSIWKLISGRYGSSYEQVANVRIDPATNTLQTVTYPHYKIHNGSSFAVFFSNTTANADDHRSCIGFTVPNTTKWSHLVITVSASAAAEFFLEEAPTIDNDDGTEQVIYNRNRNSATTSGLLSLETVPQAGEVTTFLEAEMAAANYVAGTVLDYVQLVGSTGPKAVGGVSRGTEEWMLDQGAKYLLHMQNIGANANVHTINMNWYENTALH